MRRNSLKNILVPVLFLISLLIPAFHGFIRAQEASLPELKSDKAIIYYNEACAMCAEYVKSDLPGALGKQGVAEFVKKDYINETGTRQEMNDLMSKVEVPLELRAHIMTFVGDKYILGGHIPDSIVADLFKNENSHRFKKIMIYQDEMHNEAKDYKIWAIPDYADDFVGTVMTYPINAPITEYLDYLEKNKNELKINSNKEAFILPIVLVSGFLDGINPCAFAVLLFFISFLYTLKRTKKDVWKTGAVYIAAIFLAYLAIGLGLVSTIMFINAPHAMAKLGAILVIILGIINLIGIINPKFPIKLRIPQVAKGTIKEYVHKATLPSAFVLGFLVGLCTFPCSGGIYVAIISLLVSQTTSTVGFAYLILYNIMFVMPLVIILFIVSSKRALDTFQKWEQSQVLHIKMMGAGVMIALGVIMLVWFT